MNIYIVVLSSIIFDVWVLQSSSFPFCIKGPIFVSFNIDRLIISPYENCFVDPPECTCPNKENLNKVCWSVGIRDLMNDFIFVDKLSGQACGWIF